MYIGLIQITVGAPTQPAFTQVDAFQALTILITVALIIFAAVGSVYLLRHFLQKNRNIHGGQYQNITLQVLVPKFVTEGDVKGDATIAQWQEDIAIAETFYSAIGGLTAQKGFSAWLFGRTDSLALEIVVIDKMIDFYVTVPVYMRDFIEEQLHAQYPDAAIEPVEDYNLFTPTSTVAGGYLNFKRQSMLPVKTYKESESDPLDGITNALSKIGEGEGVAIQYIVRSARPGWRGLGKKVVKNMNKGMSFEDALKGKSTWKDMFKSKDKDKPEEPRKLTQAEEQMSQRIEAKMTKAGIEANIRVVASGKSAQSVKEDLDGALKAFNQFNIYEYGNAFSAEIPNKKSRIVRDFIYRGFNPKYSIVLNTEEMASLWHLPLASTETPNIRWLESRVAPVPPEIAKEGLRLGYNEYRGVRTDVFIGDSDRRRHFYIIGKTGTGKSVFLRSLINQDIKAGKGVAVLDPHGDLADAVLGQIPKNRIDDVIYFNPSDIERPMGLNMLEAPDENMRDFAVQEMISIFYMLFPPETMGPMFEHYMRNFMLTLMADLSDTGTLIEIPRIIADDKFQAKWIARVKDPVVRSFWEDEMAKTSDYHKSETMGYLVSKVGRFVENEMMRNIIGQKNSAFNFREIMDEGKILLVNLSKGKTGEVNSNLIGLILISKLQMAAFSRADIPEDERRDFYLYIDEFQNYITPSIATILSEARKYKLNLILAHQYMGQLTDESGRTEIRDAVLGNVGSMLSARIGPDDVEVLAKVFEPTFSPYDLMNTGKFTWNAKTVANEKLLKPYTLKTEWPGEPNKKLADALKEISRLTYGRPRDIVDREIRIRAGIGMSKPTTAEPVPPSL
ncbi:MAG: DUF87 domain-containing protein [bacterium]